MRGDVLIKGLWKSYNEAIIDVRMGDPDCDYHKNNTMGTLLARWGK